jgi:hypothetical protein
MAKDPRIRAAVMFGQGKFNAGVIVDPIPEFEFDCNDKSKFAEFRDLIWSAAPKHKATGWAADRPAGIA